MCDKNPAQSIGKPRCCSRIFGRCGGEQPAAAIEQPDHTHCVVIEGHLRDAIDHAYHMLQYVINWADERGMLEDHCFTFPDGETWGAKRRTS